MLGVSSAPVFQSHTGKYATLSFTLWPKGHGYMVGIVYEGHPNKVSGSLMSVRKSLKNIEASEDLQAVVLGAKLGYAGIDAMLKDFRRLLDDDIRVEPIPETEGEYWESKVYDLFFNLGKAQKILDCVMDKLEEKLGSKYRAEAAYMIIMNVCFLQTAEIKETMLPVKKEIFGALDRGDLDRAYLVLENLQNRYPHILTKRGLKELQKLGYNVPAEAAEAYRLDHKSEVIEVEEVIPEALMTPAQALAEVLSLQRKLADNDTVLTTVDEDGDTLLVKIRKIYTLNSRAHMARSSDLIPLVSIACYYIDPESGEEIYHSGASRSRPHDLLDGLESGRYRIVPRSEMFS